MYVKAQYHMCFSKYTGFKAPVLKSETCNLMGELDRSPPRPIFSNYFAYVCFSNGKYSLFQSFQIIESYLPLLTSTDF